MSKNSKKSNFSSYSSVSEPGEPGTLAIRIRQAALKAIAGRAVSLEWDVPTDLETTFAPESLCQLVESLVRGSMDHLDEQDGTSELSVSIWNLGNRLELEVADNGSSIESRPQRFPLIAASMGVQLLWQNCPQGGAAVTAILPNAAGRREAA
jgi:hypothetical protein